MNFKGICRHLAFPSEQSTFADNTCHDKPIITCTSQESVILYVLAISSTFCRYQGEARLFSPPQVKPGFRWVWSGCWAWASPCDAMPYLIKGSSQRLKFKTFDLDIRQIYTYIYHKLKLYRQRTYKMERVNFIALPWGFWQMRPSCSFRNSIDLLYL